LAYGTGRAGRSRRKVDRHAANRDDMPMNDTGAPRHRSGNPRRFTCREHVRWSDVDAAGLIRWSAYTRLMELAETVYFRALGFTYERVFNELEIWLPRTQAHLGFHRPVLLDDDLTIEVHVGRLGGSSVQLDFRFLGPDGTLAADARAVIVSTTRQQQPRAVPLPAALRRALAPYCAKASPARTPDARGGRR
jgi:YbgC/YbaW family acyl-CoA thioester hydrolase